MLIDHYDLDVFTPPCAPGTERFNAIARLVTDISGVLPYLNAVLRGAMYNPSAGALTWVRAGHRIVFGAYQIALGDLKDREEAEAIMQQLVDTVNRTWENHEEITPDHTAYRRPAPMLVYNLLPRTNCKACGQPTCFSFALKLVAGQVALDQCPPLLDADCADQRAKLQALLPDMPAIG